LSEIVTAENTTRDGAASDPNQKRIKARVGKRISENKSNRMLLKSSAIRFRLVHRMTRRVKMRTQPTFSRMKAPSGLSKCVFRCDAPLADDKHE
jgi:hypothetical protein